MRAVVLAIFKNTKGQSCLMSARQGRAFCISPVGVEWVAAANRSQDYNQVLRFAAAICFAGSNASPLIAVGHAT